MLDLGDGGQVGAEIRVGGLAMRGKRMVARRRLVLLVGRVRGGLRHGDVERVGLGGRVLCPLLVEIVPVGEGLLEIRVVGALVEVLLLGLEALTRLHRV